MKGKYDFFDYDKCSFCGICLERCNYLHFTHEESVEEIKKLIAGEKTRILDGCIYCSACNAFCPDDCHPYELILNRVYESGRKNGIPLKAKWVMPLPYPPQNFRSALVPSMPQDEKALINKWEAQSYDLAHEEMMYAGCNLLALPYLANSKVFEDLPIFGRWDLCCGEMFYRGGVFDIVQQQADRLTEYFASSEIKRLVFMCPAGYRMFKEVLPGQFGAKFNFEPVFVAHWILDRMNSGKVKVERELDMTVTVQDSCHARIMNPSEEMEPWREILGRIGVKIVEMEHSGVDGYCCGMAAGAKQYFGLKDILTNASKALKEAKATGASELVTYCAGCYLTAGMGGLLSYRGQPTRHVMEYLKYAIGEPLDTRIKLRTLHTVAGLLLHVLIPAIFRGNRTYMPTLNAIWTKEGRI